MVEKTEAATPGAGAETVVDPDAAAEALFEQVVAKQMGEEPAPEAAKEPEAKDAGAADAAKAEAAKPDEPEKKEQDKPAKPAAAPEIDWSKAPPEAKAAYDDAVEKAKRYQGMVQPLQRQNDDLQHRLKRATTGAAKPEPGNAEAGKPSAGVQAILDRDDVKKALTDFPEMKPIVDALVTAGMPNKDLADKVQSLLDERQDQERQKVETFITSHHADFYTDVASDPRFFAWVKDQPKAIQNAVARNQGVIRDPVEVVEIVTLYKEANGLAPKKPSADPAPAGGGHTQKPPALSAKQQRQLESASTPRPSAPARVSNKPPADADPEALFSARVASLTKSRAPAAA